TGALRALARRQGATLFMLLLAAFQSLLGRLAGTADVAVGSPVAGRTRKELEGLVGFFVNTLVLRADLAGNPTFLELLARVKEAALGAYDHQDVPFEKLVEELAPARDLTRSPLFQAFFALQEDDPRTRAVRAGELALEPLPLPSGAIGTKFDLTLSLALDLDGLRGSLIYATDRFEPDTARRLTLRLRALLEAVARNPQARLTDLPLLLDDERQALATRNTTLAPYPQTTAHQLFEAQAESTPDAPALVADRERMTYAQLEWRANRLAHRLRDRGVGPEARVGICLERSTDLVVALLAVLKAGGAYVPLDPDLPPERLAFFVADSGVQTIVTLRSLSSSMPETAARPLYLDEAPGVEGGEPGERLAPSAHPDNLAYVIYTSGSTGVPKGVAVPHRGLCNLITAQRQALGIEPGMAVLHFARLGFDASAWEIFATLAAGATLHLAQPEEMRPGLDLAVLLRERQIAWVTLPPSALAVLPDEPLPALRRLVVAGEPCPPELAQVWGRRTRLFNGYGPTEATVCATLFAFDPATAELPIGRPLQNVFVYVLGPDLSPLPDGVPGELHIGGVAVTRGYVARPALTAASFVPDPFSGVPGSRMYRTGDRVRVRPDGNLEFLGRLDHQVKVRGHRIELGEIEAALAALPGVREAAVVAREDRPGGRQLCAYVVAEGGVTPGAEALRTRLAARLPKYMIPSSFVALDRLPLSSNGKLDRRALPAPARAAYGASGAHVPPRDRLELAIAESFRACLGVQPIGAHDDFFALGGHSLLAVQLVTHIERRLGRRLPLAKLFGGATVEALAIALRDDTATPPASPLVTLRGGDARPPLYVVHAVGGAALSYLALADALGDDQPFYAFQARGVDDDAAPRDDLGAMAEAYVEALRSARPAGRYWLAGWSFGGVVAHEMARQLEACGDAPAGLILLDTWLPMPGEGAPPDDPTLLAIIARELASISPRAPAPEGPWASRDEAVARLGAWAEAEGVVPAGFAERYLRRAFATHEAHLRALRHHRPGYSGVRTAIVRPETLPPPYASRALADPSGGFGDVSRGRLEIHRTPGDHFSMLRPPHVARLAEILRARMDEAVPGKRDEATSPGEHSGEVERR
ncbi:MAG: amino acid adenylation domain-containing protein, partial [Polyangiaceae bacterium]|nr:amino acid adenylation domain-containing protein [Polyangiaceae bacterium]